MENKVQVIKKLHEEVDLTSYKFCPLYYLQLQPMELKELLPRLIPMFLAYMTSADDDKTLWDEEEDEAVPDKDDDSLNVCNLRECSAKAIESISTDFGNELFPIIMPFIKKRLSLLHDEDWKKREVAIFALGAIAEGCIKFLYPHISKLVGLLLSLLDDRFPLVQSISCWTLRRYSKYLIQENSHRPKDYHEQFEKILMGLLGKLLDTNKCVQQAACSAFAIFEQDAGKELVPHIKVILQHLMCAFGKYQKRNLRIAYDAIGNLAESVGEELNKLVYIEILMPPLVSKWPPLPISHKDVFPLLKCYTSISKALGVGLTPYAQPILQKCMYIIQLQELNEVDSVSDGTKYDKQIIVCSLAFISRLAERLESGIDTQGFQSILVDLLCKVVKDEDIDVKLCTFNFLGDLIRALGVGFAQHVFRRCMDIFQLQQLDEVELAFFGAQNVRETISSSLQLLCGLTYVLGSGIESLVSQSNLRDILLKCCMDESSDVRIYAFSLMCEFARVFTVYLEPHLLGFLEIASKELNFDFIRENFYAANNACLVIGELVVKFPHHKVSPLFVVNVVTSLGLYLRHKETLIAKIEAIRVGMSKATPAENIEIIQVVNSAFTLGILAWFYPDLVAPHMANYIRPWCLTLSTICDGIKKEEAFRGLCAVVKANPSEGFKSLGYIFLAIASWHEIRNEDVKQECSQVLNDYKQMLGNSWEVYFFGFIPGYVRERLARYLV